MAQKQATSSPKITYYDAAAKLEELLIREEGKRGIKGGVKALYGPDLGGQLYDAAAAIFEKKVQAVGILVGSTTNMIMWPPTDTDGPGGAFALAHTLMTMGKHVYIICDEVNDEQVYRALKKSEAWKLQEKTDHSYVLVYTKFPDARKWTNDKLEENRLRKIFDKVDHFINVGRPGPADDNHYWSFEKRQMTHYQPPFDKVFGWAEDSRGSDHHVKTTCIGELGNELGIGQIKIRVEEKVPEGLKIACGIKADFTIVATVVNWGAYGLCAMLAILEICHAPLDQMLLLDDLYPTRADQAAILRTLVEEASRCGVTGTRDQIVDDFPATKNWEIMEAIRNEARELVRQLRPEIEKQMTPIVVSKGHYSVSASKSTQLKGKEKSDSHDKRAQNTTVGGKIETTTEDGTTKAVVDEAMKPKGLEKTVIPSVAIA